MQRQPWSSLVVSPPLPLIGSSSRGSRAGAEAMEAAAAGGIASALPLTRCAQSQYPVPRSRDPSSTRARCHTPLQEAAAGSRSGSSGPVISSCR